MSIDATTDLDALEAELRAERIRRLDREFWAAHAVVFGFYGDNRNWEAILQNEESLRKWRAGADNLLAAAKARGWRTPEDADDELWGERFHRQAAVIGRLHAELAQRRPGELPPMPTRAELAAVYRGRMRDGETSDEALEAVAKLARGEL